ncbi:protein unc-50 [Tanacetum coccineum]
MDAATNIPSTISVKTKNQWARDDPAFIVICILLLAVSAVAYSVAYDHSIGHTVFVVFSATCIHFLLAGAIVATFCWFVTNTYLREETSNSHVVEQRVEWLYAFDVHCNSFFPLFIVLYGSYTFFRLASSGGAWLCSSSAVKSYFYGGHNVLSLP